jgi:shikimate kinase
MKKLLFAGVPGTGKTALGEYMAEKHGFFHQDMEIAKFEPVRKFEEDPVSFLGSFASHEDIVVSWGFGPFNNREEIEVFIADGFKLFWFDGDRTASFRHFMRRENQDEKMELAYYSQMQMVITTRIIDLLKPVIINPFEDNGDFRPKEEIAQDVLSHC